AERPAGPQAARPGAPESEELPDAVELEAAWLDGITREMTREVPVVGRHPALGDGDSAPSAVALELEDPVEHQHGRRRKPGGERRRRVREEPSACAGEGALGCAGLQERELRG